MIRFYLLLLLLSDDSLHFFVVNSEKILHLLLVEVAGRRGTVEALARGLLGWLCEMILIYPPLLHLNDLLLKTLFLVALFFVHLI